jgi:hypothetical protein
MLFRAPAPKAGVYRQFHHARAPRSVRRASPPSGALSNLTNLRARNDNRRIILTDWQGEVATAHVEPFLRGLIHSDGTRFLATERSRGSVRRVVRYAFSNRSEDILGIFRSAYTKASVARLDEFVGAKS